MIKDIIMRRNVGPPCLIMIASDHQHDGPDIRLLGSFGVREILSRTPKGYWTVSVRFVVLCALVVVSVAVATKV
jgi:hypothetical protein